MRSTSQIFIILFITSFLGCSSSKRSQQYFSDLFLYSNIDKITVIIDDVRIYKESTYSNQERDYDSEILFLKYLHSATNKALKAQNIESQFLNAKGQSKLELTNLHQVIMNKSSEISYQLRSKENPRKSLILNNKTNSRLALLSKKIETPYILFISGYGNYFTFGRIVEDVIKTVLLFPIVGPLLDFNKTGLSFTLVNADQAEILWLSEKSDNVNPREMDSVKKLTEYAIADIIPINLFEKVPRNRQLNFFTKSKKKVYGTLVHVNRTSLHIRIRNKKIIILPIKAIKIIQSPDYGAQIFYKANE